MLVLLDAGKLWLSTNWKLCKPLKTGDDVEDLKSWLSDAYTNLAMINYPYPSDFLLPVPAKPVAVSGILCPYCYSHLCFNKEFTRWNQQMH